MTRRAAARTNADPPAVERPPTGGTRAPKRRLPQVALSHLDPRSKPLYEQVGDLIRQRLVENYWPPGGALPSEIQLAKDLGVSQGTVRKALDDLVAENLLYRRQGLGTFVPEHTERRALFLYFNLVRDDGGRELPQSRLLSCRQLAATAEERAQLGLSARARVVRFSRVRYLDGAPTIVDRIALPQALFPDLGKGRMPPNHLYRFYQTEYGITIGKARELASAVAATAKEAAQLEIAASTPLLQVDRIAYGLDGRPIEWRVSRCHTRYYRYLSERG